MVHDDWLASPRVLFEELASEYSFEFVSAEYTDGEDRESAWVVLLEPITRTPTNLHFSLDQVLDLEDLEGWVRGTFKMIYAVYWGAPLVG